MRKSLLDPPLYQLKEAWKQASLKERRQFMHWLLRSGDLFKMIDIPAAPDVADIIRQADSDLNDNPGIKD